MTRGLRVIERAFGASATIVFMEEVLKDDAHRRIVLVDGTLRRPTYPWSPAVHVLLKHLESVGFDLAPRFLGIDEEGREILTFIDGIAGADGANGPGHGADIWAMVATDDGLARFARLLRTYHDAIANFTPPPELTWATPQRSPKEGDIVCHNDFGPWNVVWRSDGTPVGIIDWDYAGPAPSIDDVAFAIEWSVPFASDEDCLTWRRFSAPPDRRRRVEVFADAYGLTSTSHLVDAVLARQRKFRAAVLDHAGRGIPLAIDEVASGYLDVVDARIQWTETNRHLFE